MSKPYTDLVELEHPVAILDEHLMEMPPDPVTGKGKDPIYLSKELLQKICDNNNRRIKETGDMAPVVLGHTQEGLPERAQPELMGFSKDFVVRPFKKGKHAIFSRWLIFKNKLQKLKEYPRRSVELWVGKWEIDPISILGATTPDRDLGLIRLARSGDATVTRVLGDTNVENNELIEQILAQVREEPWAKFAQELMSQAEAMENEPGPEEGGAMGGEPMGEPTPDAQEGGPPPVNEEQSGPPGMPPEETQPGEEEEGPVQKAAASPSGGNTFVPGGMEKRQMSRLATLEAANQALQIKFARASRRADLIQLQAEHNVDFDLNEELNSVAPEDELPLSETKYQAHLQRIVKRYQRAPVNTATIITRTGPQANTKARVDAAVELATSKGIPFNDALEQVSN